MRRWPPDHSARLLSRISVALMLLVLLAPAGALAYRTQGKGSADGREVTYFNSVSQHDWAVRQAVRAWNRSGANIRFVPAHRGKAELVINAGSAPGTGRTETTFRDEGAKPGDAQVSIPSPSAASRRDERFTVALIATHELGHVLKLDHEDSGCATMNSVIVNGAPARCRQPPPGKWDCRLLEEDDVRGVVALYGGTPRLRGPKFCPKVQPKPKPPPPVSPESVGAVRVLPSFGRSPRVTVRWRNGDSAKIRASVVARARGHCPDEPSAGETKTVPAEPGSEGRVTFSLQLERSCYAVWLRDRSGSLSRRPATAWLDPPPPPRPPVDFAAETALADLFGGTGASLRWRNAEEDPLKSILIARQRGRCPSRAPHRSPPWNEPSAQGTFQEHFDLGFYPSRDVQHFCYAAWSRDQFGRLSRRVVAWPMPPAEEEGVIVLAD